MGSTPITNTTLFTPVPNTTTSPQGRGNTTTAGSDGSVEMFLYISLLIFVIVAGFIGNTLVIATICGRRSMKTPCNLFLMNIAIADLLVAIVLTPFRVAELFYGWPLGEFLCQFFGPIQEVIVSVSIVTHTVIALERYRGIVTPFKTKLSLHKAKLATVVIWGACYLATGLPLALVLRQQEKRGHKYCKAEWPSITSRRVFEVYLVFFFIVLPLIVQTATYSMVVATIKREDVSDQSVSRSGTIEQRRNQIRKKTRLVKMLIILVAVFQLCYIPRGIFMLFDEFISKQYKKEHKAGMSNAAISTIILYYLKHVINPFILFAMSTEFRKNCFPTGCQKSGMTTGGSSVVKYFSRNSGGSKSSSPLKHGVVERRTSKTALHGVDGNKNRETNV